MGWIKRGFGKGNGAPIENFRLWVSALAGVDEGEVIQGLAKIGMLGRNSFVKGNRANQELLGLAKPSLFPVKRSEIVQRNDQIRMIATQRLLGCRKRTLIKRFGVAI